MPATREPALLRTTPPIMYTPAGVSTHRYWTTSAENCALTVTAFRPPQVVSANLSTVAVWPPNGLLHAVTASCAADGPTLIASPVADWKFLMSALVVPAAHVHPVGTIAVQVGLAMVCPAEQRVVVGNDVGPSEARVVGVADEGRELAGSDDDAFAAEAEVRGLADVAALAVQAAGTAARGAGSMYDSATRTIVRSATAPTPAATQGVFALGEGSSAASSVGASPAVASVGGSFGADSSRDGSVSGVWSPSSVTPGLRHFHSHAELTVPMAATTLSRVPRAGAPTIV